MRSFEEIKADYIKINRELSAYVEANPEDKVVLFNTVGRIEKGRLKGSSVDVFGSLVGESDDIVTVFAQPDNEAFQTLMDIMTQPGVLAYIAHIEAEADKDE